MVSRREKLKLLQSKAQEQMFNLHVKLVNQEASAGEPSTTQELLGSHVSTCTHFRIFAKLVWTFPHS